MKTNLVDLNNPSDDELLAGVRRRLTGVESLVPLPPVWEAAERSSAKVHVGIRSKVGFAGLAPLVLVAVLVVVAVGYGLGARVWTGAGSTARTPTPDRVTINCEMVSATGQKPRAADLDLTVSILLSRLRSSGVVDYAIASGPGSQIITVSLPTTADVETIRALILRTGRLEFVLLPSAQYGTANAAGARPVPAKGDTIDPALPAQFTGADLDPAKIQAAVDMTKATGSWKVSFGFTIAKASQFETWTGAHVNEYLAIVVDGVVQNAPSIFSAVTGGSGDISGDYTQSEASQLAAVLKAGQLPYPLALVEATSPSGPSASQPAASFPAVVSAGAHVPSDIPSAGRTLGVATAPVTLDVWVDFQCSACRSFKEQTQTQLIANYVRQGKVKIAYHDFNVIDAGNGGHDSENAAAAARIAADQGKFWAYVDLLWANQQSEQVGEFSRDRLIEMARLAGLDVPSFTAAVDAGTHLADVRAESSAGLAAGLNSTPAVLVNGKAITTVDYATISAAIDLSLAGPSKSMATGTAGPVATGPLAPSTTAPAGPVATTPATIPAVNAPTQVGPPDPTVVTSPGR